MATRIDLVRIKSAGNELECPLERWERLTEPEKAAIKRWLDRRGGLIMAPLCVDMEHCTEVLIGEPHERRTLVVWGA